MSDSQIGMGSRSPISHLPSSESRALSSSGTTAEVVKSGAIARLTRRGADSGAAMVELALVLSLLVMLLVGTVSAAIAFGRNNSIENAAREASRYAATLPGPVDTDWLKDVRDVARAAAMGDLDTSVDGQHICVAHYNGSAWTRLTDTGGSEATSSTNCFTDGLPATQSRVQIVARRDTSLEAVFFSIDVTLEGEASARYER